MAAYFFSWAQAHSRPSAMTRVITFHVGRRAAVAERGAEHPALAIAVDPGHNLVLLGNLGSVDTVNETGSGDCSAMPLVRMGWQRL